MRIIKFRAKAVVNQKWNNIKVGDFVFGSFIHSNVDAPCITFGDGEQVEIDVKTLGQLTGFKDFKSVNVFEGDKFHDGINYCVITWHSETASFRAFDGYESHELGEHTKRATVIGNIHEGK